MLKNGIKFQVYVHDLCSMIKLEVLARRPNTITVVYTFKGRFSLHSGTNIEQFPS